MKQLILTATCLSTIPNVLAFASVRRPIQKERCQLNGESMSKELSVALFAEINDNEGINSNNQFDGGEEEKLADGAGLKALASVSSSVDGANKQEKDASMTDDDTVSSQLFMVPREMKRILVEELGYKRREVDTIRLELVPNIIKNRIRCPLEGMPVEWVDRDREDINESIEGNSNMMERLESESKYPLKFPLLAISLVLFGKGFSDALITAIKVNMSFPGASLTAQFQGIPVLAIDVFCMVVGVGLGTWAWKTMK